MSMGSSSPQARWQIAPLIAALLLLCAAGCSPDGAGRQPATDIQADIWWEGYGKGPDNSRFFPSRQISKSNLAELEVAWTYPHGDTGSGPIVVHGVIYGRGRNGSLVAVDAATGDEIWIRENMNGMTSRGINYWENADGTDRRLIFAMDSLLQEVDARTGESIRAFGDGGVVDLRVGIDGRDPASIGNIQSNTPGEVFENLIILGSATGEGYFSPPGDIRAYDVVTGELVWTFHTVPRPGEFGYETWPEDAWTYIGGTNNWGEITIDSERAIAYIPLGSPTYDFYGADRAGANLFGTSIVALDARTGERVWHFQLVHHDLWDLDPSAAPQLTTIQHEGERRDVVAVGGKSGWLYVFDRATGEPVWPIEERPVPQSEMPLETSWPTQPFPTAPPPFSKHSFGVEDISPYLPEAEAEAIRERLLAAANLGVFTPISLDDTVHIPTSNGGVLFGGMAGEPDSGAVYVVAHDNPGILHLVDPDENAGRRSGPPVQPGQVVYQEHCQVCHGTDRLGTDTGVALVHAEADAENDIAAGAPVFNGDQIRGILAAGNGRMPSFPHLEEGAVDDLVAWLTTPAGGRGFGGFGRRGGGPAGSGAPPELIAGSGSAAERPAGGRSAGPGYPEGSPDWQRYTINEYNTVGNRIAPPYTSIVKYDLNTASIAWRVGFGDDPALAGRGITGTGVAGLLNGVIVTGSDLVFAAGGDNRIRAYDGATGERLWSAPFGGNFVGSPVMYQMEGRQYLLVPAAGSPPRGGGPAPDAPLGWIAYALPVQAN